MIYSLTLFSSQGKLRLQKWYICLSDKQKRKLTRETMQLILPRKNKLSNFIEYKQYKLVYKKYASLFFCCMVNADDNELLILETIHRYVELLDKYFGNVCELDIVFNFEKAHHILDEYLLGGEVQESSMKTVVSAIHQMDLIQEEQEEPPSLLEELGF